MPSLAQPGTAPSRFKKLREAGARRCTYKITQPLLRFASRHLPSRHTTLHQPQSPQGEQHDSPSSCLAEPTASYLNTRNSTLAPHPAKADGWNHTITANSNHPLQPSTRTPTVLTTMCTSHRHPPKSQTPTPPQSYRSQLLHKIARTTDIGDERRGGRAAYPVARTIIAPMTTTPLRPFPPVV